MDDKSRSSSEVLFTGMSSEKYYYKTSSQKYYMQPSKPSIVQLNEERPAREKKGDARRQVRLGIVVMTKGPLDFEEWLRYHYYIIGVERFYVRCENTPELATIMRKSPWSAVVEIEYYMHTERDYFIQMDRQAKHVAKVVPRAKAAGLEWLLHIDDDELLFCANGRESFMEVLETLDPNVVEAHIQNIEALAPNENCSQPFRAKSFVVSTTKFASYTNGKSIGRLSFEIRAHGPHHFRALATHTEKKFQEEQAHVSPSTAVILHYESCTYERWSHKFLELARRHGHNPSTVKKVPFPFYRESLEAMLKLSFIQYNSLSPTLSPHYGTHLLDRVRKHSQQHTSPFLPLNTHSATEIVSLALCTYDIWASHKLDSSSRTRLAPDEIIQLDAVPSLLTAPRIFPSSHHFLTNQYHPHQDSYSSHYYYQPILAANSNHLDPSSASSSSSSSLSTSLIAETSSNSPLPPGRAPTSSSRLSSSAGHPRRRRIKQHPRRAPPTPAVTPSSSSFRLQK